MCKNSIWIVAVSGGPDSMALLDVLYKINYKLVVAHVNYLTRNTSLRDENIVRNYCEQRNIKFRMKNFDLQTVNNFQNDAREFRYEFFKELGREYSAQGVAMGHHFNDDLETYVFQKQRNMHSDYIGMAKETQVKGITVWRPLLDKSKEWMLEYCHSNNIEFGIDESNLELDYTRNKIRHAISQMSREEYQSLLNEKNHDTEVWGAQKLEILDSVNSWETLVPVATYAKITESNRFLYLREWLRHNGVDVHEISEDYLKEMDRNIIKKTANYQFENMKLISSYDDISLFNTIEYEYKLESIEYFEAKQFSIKNKGLIRQGLTVSMEDFPLIIRNVKKGDKIKMKFGSKKVSRYLIDEKIPHSERFSWPVIENVNKDIIFVTGMGCDVHHYSNNPSFYMVEY